jgi:hypothetical protein
MAAEARSLYTLDPETPFYASNKDDPICLL